MSPGSPSCCKIEMQPLRLGVRGGVGTCSWVFWVFGLLRGCGAQGAVGECGERSQQRLGDRNIRGEEARRRQRC